MKTRLLLLTLLLLVSLSIASAADERIQLQIDPQLEIQLNEQGGASVILEPIDEALLAQDVRRHVPHRMRTLRTIQDKYIVLTLNQAELRTLQNTNNLRSLHLNRQDYSFDIQQNAPLLAPQSLWSNGANGNNIKLAILDSGIKQDHPDLKTNIIDNKHFITTSPQDTNGHGTHVAGIALSIAPQVSILNIKVLDDEGDGSTESIANGIYYAVENGADIISLSLGAPTNAQDEIVNEAIDHAINNDVIVIASAGNCGDQPVVGCGSFKGVTIPASYKPVLAVGATDENFNLAPFSSYQNFNTYTKPDVVAPGVDITSAGLTGYTTKSGTSMAAPFVSGAAALLLNEFQPSQIKSKLQEHTKDLGEQGFDLKHGAGFVTFDDEQEVIDETTTPQDQEDDQQLITKSIGNFILIQHRDHSVQKGEETEYALYTTEQENPVVIHRTKFKNTTEFTRYLYDAYPLENQDQIQFVHDPFDYFTYDDKIVWYVGNTLFELENQDDVDISPILAAYSTSTNVGSNQEEHSNNLQSYSDAVISEMTVSFTDADFTSLEGGPDSNQAKSYTFGTSLSESYDIENAPNWYYTQTAKSGYLTFRVQQISSGDDLDLYILDYQGNVMCSSKNDENSLEKCVIYKSVPDTWGFYIYVVPTQISGDSASGTITSWSDPCEEKLLNQYQCSGSYLQRKKQFADCDTGWVNDQNCNDYDDESNAWQKTCTSNDILKQHKTVIDGVCSANSCKPVINSQVQTLENCGVKPDECSSDNGGVLYKNSYCHDEELGCFFADSIQCENCQDGMCLSLCGDGICQDGETKTSCSQDCYVDYNIQITNVNPAQAQEDEDVTITAQVTSVGTIHESTFIEAGIVPTSWTSFGAAGVGEASEPCPQNNYYQSKEVFLSSSLTSETVTFNVIAPEKDTVDECDLIPPKKSAWSSSFSIISGTYELESGGDYTSYTTKSYSVGSAPLPPEEVCPNGIDNSPGCQCNEQVTCNSGMYCSDGNCISNEIPEEPDPIPEFCSGVVDVGVENVNYLGGYEVTVDGVGYGATGSSGKKVVPIENSKCSKNMDVVVYCASDPNEICESDIASIDLDGDTDSFSFDCSLCESDKNLWIDLSDVDVIYVGANQFEVRININSIDINQDVDVRFSPVNRKSGLVIDGEVVTKTVNSNSQASALFDQIKSDSYVDFVMVQIDPDKKIQESKRDNFVMVPIVKQKISAEYNINTGNNIADEAIEEYLSFFFTEDSPSAKLILNIGKPKFDIDLDNWNYSSHTIWVDGESLGGKPYTGIIGYESSIIGDQNVYVIGTELEGIIAAVKRLVNARNSLSKSPFIIDQYDVMGIGVYDLLHNPENEPHYGKNNNDFKEVVLDILMDNNYEAAIKTVKTTNDGTILRMKNLNSDFSEKFKDVVVSSDKPVVIQGGIFSNLHSFEDGIGEELVQEGHDVWLTEQTGGPNTECDDCPNYLYGDLVTYYWPALMSGVIEYSGKNKINYIGHSNGCRVALSSLNEYSKVGKNQAGLCLGLETGDYGVECDLPSYPIDKFFGIGCPANLNEEFTFTRSARELENGQHMGNLAIENLKKQGKNHIKSRDYASKTQKGVKRLVTWILTSGGHKISLNLMGYYNGLAINSNSSMELMDVRVNNLYLFAGTTGLPLDKSSDAINDRAVPLSDLHFINSSVDSNNVLFEMKATHSGLMKDSKVKKIIKGYLND